MTNLDDFIEFYSEPEDEVLRELTRETHIKTLMPRMLSGYVQGKLLEHISKMMKPKFILELGTFTGYSALCLVKGLQNGGQLHTVEIDDEQEAMIRKYISKSNNEEKITLHIGDALDVIADLDVIFDLVFIDADKRIYADYYTAVFDKVRSGGYFLIDNVLWDNKVLEPEAHTDKYTQGILKLLEIIKNDVRVEPVILPLRDGLMLVRKK